MTQKTLADFLPCQFVSKFKMYYLHFQNANYCILDHSDIRVGAFLHLALAAKTVKTNRNEEKERDGVGSI